MDRDVIALQRGLQRAVSARSHAVIFPAHLLIYPLRQQCLDLCRQMGLQPVIQVHLQSLQPIHRDLLRNLLEEGCGLNVVLNQAPVVGEWDWLKTAAKVVYFTWLAKRGQAVVREVNLLPDWVRQDLYFYFPFHFSSQDGNLSCSAVNRVVTQIHRSCPGVKVRPPRGIELWDPRIASDLCLEPTEGPLFTCQTDQPKPKISVVIPTYNNREYLLNVLDHLAQQEMEHNDYEVIVVDDGSTDGTYRAVMNTFGSQRTQWNFKYIFFPRKRPRQMGDSAFRAGIARNLGVKSATGEILCFLDSDILTPPHFLKDLWEKHQTWDVVQCTRFHLKEDSSDRTTRYADINCEQDTFFTDGKYWENFYATPDWQSLPFFWKYVCTYGLSLRRDVFHSIGWLKRTFIFYGFEDTELGYRLAQAGLRFYLNPIVTYHLYHGVQRSEYQNHDYFRHQLLCKTARIFYLHSLEEDVFAHFRNYMDGDWGVVSVGLGWLAYGVKSVVKICQRGLRKANFVFRQVLSLAHFYFRRVRIMRERKG